MQAQVIQHKNEDEKKEKLREIELNKKKEEIAALIIQVKQCGSKNDNKENDK